MAIASAEIASIIDHTLLKPDATIREIEQLCREAVEHTFAAVCINPYWIPTVKPLLNGSGVKLCTVAGFPLGASLSKTKIAETRDAAEAGADEIDMVMNVGAALEDHWNFIEHEIHDVVSAAHGKTVKVILETCLLDPARIAEACKAAERGGANYVKTSTGFSKGGATVEAVKTMRGAVSCHIGVKASGGIRDRAAAEAMIEAGATRLGTSAGVAIVAGSEGTGSY
jgi:deoxyribose-phosphate aldolase